MLTEGVVLLHDNARPHAAGLAQYFNQALQLGDFQPRSLQSGLGTKQLPSLHQYEGLVGYPALPHQRRVNNWLQYLAALFFDEGLQKLVSWYDKCLNVDGKYVEK
jgi:hypothetical protein